MKIFVTIGTQEPFDRLIRAMDEIAPLLHNVSVTAQVSHSDYKPQHMEAFQFLSPDQFDHYFSTADLIVSHAGMGTIISALVDKKSVIVMPRMLKFKEHRSDHQIATAKVFEKLNYVEVVNSKEELQQKILYILENLTVQKPFLDRYASIDLINTLKNEINSR